MHKEFLNRRKLQEKIHFQKNDESGIMSSLVVIEINLTELCNRKCVFCPRVDPKVFPNRNLHIELNLIEKIAKDLKELNFSGRISFSGFGEPLLAKNFEKIISIFRKNVINCDLETNTNGDKINPKKIKDLFSAGLTSLYLNAYDGPEQVGKYESMIDESGIDKNNFFIRPHWEGYHKDWGLFLNNRSGLIENTSNEYLKPLEASLSRKCYYPFYKMFIDFDGKVLFCSNDWGRVNVVGDLNHESVKDIWLSDELNYFRRKLSKKDRSSNPCNKCSINGELHGEESYKKLEKYLKL